MPTIADFIGAQGGATDPLGLTRGQAGQPASVLDRFAQDKERRLSEIEQMGPIRRFFGPNAERQDIMRELLAVEEMKRKQQATTVQSVAELRKQQAAHLDSVRNFTKGYWDILKDLKGESEDSQKTLRPFVAKRMKRDNKAFAMGLDDEDIDNFVNVEGFADQAIAAIDPFLTEQETAVNRKRLAQAKPSEREAIYKDINARVTERVQAVVREKMPQLIREVGASGKPVTPDLLKRVLASPQFAERLGTFGQSLVLQREAHAFLDDPKNAKTLVQYGVTGIGEALLEGQKKKAEMDVTGQVGFSPSQVGLGEKIAGFVQQTNQWKGLTRQGVTMRDWNDNTKVPPDLRQEMLSAARQLETEQGETVASATGKAGLVAAERAKADQPLIVSMPDRHVVDRKTGQFVDRTAMTRKQLTERGGEKAFAVLDKDETKAYRGVVEARVLMDQYADVAQKLAKAPGANLAQQFDVVTKTFLGIPNVGVDLDSLRGSILRIAGTMQGSRVQLSDNDVKAVAGMIPSAADSTGTALQRLGNVMKILDVMGRVALGDVPNSALHDLLNKTLRPKLKSAEPVR